MAHTLDVKRLPEILKISRNSIQLGELSKWESDFIESVSEQYERRGSLSDRQLEIVEQIWCDKVKGL